jgi:hypothetical protein
MKDEGIIIDPDQPLSTSERAVLYLLRRIRLDANLRWYMLHTEAFQLLCEAESQRRHNTPQPAREFKSDDELHEWFKDYGEKNCPDGVMKFYSTPAEHCKDEVAEVVKLRKKLEAAPEEKRREPDQGDHRIERVYSEVPAWLTETAS